MSDFLFNGLWIFGFILTFEGLLAQRKYKYSDWEYWGSLVCAAIGSGMMMHWVKSQ